jgi:hypothetical protein
MRGLLKRWWFWGLLIGLALICLLAGSTAWNVVSYWLASARFDDVREGMTVEAAIVLVGVVAVNGPTATERAIMETLPFEATFDALAFIVKQIRFATPHFSEFVPALLPTGGIIDNIPCEHFTLGWYRPENVTDAIEVDLWGHRLFLHRETLDRFVGKQLVLTTGRSMGADGQFLRAFPHVGP